MTLPFDSMPMPDWLGWRAKVTPERLAVIASRECWTFAELDVCVSRVARQLAGLGVRQGDRVAMMLANSARVVEVVHAVGRLGAVLVPVNIRLTAAEICWQLKDAGANLLIFDDRTASLAAEISRSLPSLTAVDARFDGVSEIAAPLRQRIDPAEVQSIIYTSGTTGRPKGAMLTWGNHWWSAIGSSLNLGNRADDRWLAVLPLFHVGGLSILMRSVIYGIAAVIHETFDPEAVNRAIDEDQVTIVSVVATMLQRMLAARGDRPYPPTLRCVLLGGGPAPRPLLEACAGSGVPVMQTYGLTETASQVATLSPEDALRKLGSAGKPLFPNEVRIDAVQVGDPGEILVRGPIVTSGYAGRSQETAQALRDGWLHTGDVGYLDTDGYLYVLDRRDDLIVSGGENVYPAEVEAVLLAHPAVEEAGVIGVPNPEWGQATVAVARLTTDVPITESDLRAFCRERLGGYKVPAEIRFIDSMPRNASGKLLRRQLREWWSQN